MNILEMIYRGKNLAQIKAIYKELSMVECRDLIAEYRTQRGF